MLVTIAIPCYKSAKTLPKVIEEIEATFNTLPHDYEIVLVNDSPNSGTFEVIKQLSKKNRKILGVDLSKNSGQASARMATVRYANGDMIVFMDDDGQHPADEIYKFIEKIEQGYDVVYAKIVNKKHSVFKKITSRLNTILLEAMGIAPKGLSLSSFFAISRFCADQILEYKSPFPSMMSFLMQITSKITNVEVRHRERVTGKSGYTLSKLVNLALNNVTNFSMIPLRIATFLGFIAALIGFLYGIIIIVMKLINPDRVSGYTSIMAVMLFLGGLIMIMLGILGEFIGRIYMTSSNKPQYIVRETVNINKCKHEDEKEELSR